MHAPHRFLHLLALLLATPAVAGTRFVDVSLVSGANDGSSWANAHQGVDGIQAALALAVAGDEIWVADGTYKPTATLTRTIAIDMKSGVAILGGFAGGETLASQANPALNVTILTGDLAGDDGGGAVAENSVHIVRGAGADATAIIDGFTIQGGNANAAGTDNDRGGGLLFVGSSHGTVRRCIVRDNRCSFGGGAGYIRGSSPTFLDCTFEDNFGASFGGAFDTANNNGATFDRCVFRGNTASRAGALEIFGGATTKVYNSLFVENTSTGAGGGGALWIGSSSTPTIRNCTIVENNSNVHAAAGILVTGSTASVASCIVESNTGPGGAQGAANQISGSTVNVSYSLVMGGFTGTGNVDALPKFVNRADGDYRLRVNSRAVDAGDSTAVAPGVVSDLAGAPRLVDHPVASDYGNGSPLVDMGAYETVVLPLTRYCFGDGQELACPCGNQVPGSLGGCTSSNGNPAALGGVGDVSVANDTLVMAAGSLPGPLVSSAILLQGTRIAQTPFNDGHLCINGTLLRLGIQTVQIAGFVSYPAPGDPSLSVAGAVSPGDVRTYQVQYRNAVAFCTAATVNQTNGVAVIWQP